MSDFNTPNIITSIPRYSDGEVDREFMKELQNGFEIERRTEALREKRARKEAHELRGKTHPVLGETSGNNASSRVF